MKRARHMMESSEALERVLGMSLDDPRISTEPTLSRSTWQARLNTIERAVLDGLKSDRSEESATVSAQVLASAASAYHALLKGRAQCVPLTDEDWERWLAVLAELHRGADEHAATVIAGLVREVEQLQCAFTWGSLSDARRRQQAHESALAALTDTIPDVLEGALASTEASAPCNGEDETHVDADGTACLRAGGVASVLSTAFGDHLEAHGREAYDVGAEYMPSPAPSVEAALREHLLEPLLTALEDALESAQDEGMGTVEETGGLPGVRAARKARCEGMRALVEGWMRASFRRDAYLSNYQPEQELLEVYEAFEVDDKRNADMRTLLSHVRGDAFARWRTAAEALTAHTLMCVQDTGKRGLASTVSETTDRVRGLLDAWAGVRPPAGVPRPTPPQTYRTLYVSMRRLLDMDVFPGRFTDGTLEKLLSPLHAWLVQYLGDPHRFTWEYPFADERDERLWSFLLERHHVLLVRSLAAAREELENASSPANGSDQSSEEREMVALAVFAVMLARVRTIVLSVLHAWQAHLSLLASSDCMASPAKRTLRSHESTRQVRAWLRGVFIDRIAKGFMNDLYDLCDACDMTQAGRVSALVLEATLKMRICEAQMCVAAAARHAAASPEDAETYHEDLTECRKRLSAIYEAVRELASELLSATAAPDGNRAHVLSLLGVGAQLLEQLSALQAEETPSPAAMGWARRVAEDQDFHHSLHHLHKSFLRLLSTAGALPSGEVVVPLLREQTLSRLTRLFARYPPVAGAAVPLSAGEPALSSAKAHQVPCSAMYADVRNVSKAGRGRGERVPLGGLMDIACEELSGKWHRSDDSLSR